MGICFVMGLILLDFQMFSMFSFSKYFLVQISQLHKSFPLFRQVSFPHVHSQFSYLLSQLHFLLNSCESHLICRIVSAVFSPEICGKFAVIPECFRIFKDKSNASASCVILRLLREIIFE